MCRTIYALIRSRASPRSPQPRHCSARSASTATARSRSLVSPIAAPDSTAPSSHRISDKEVLVMKFNRFLRLVSITALLSLLAVASGCIVKETSRNDNGDKATESKGAEITTPFGTLRARNEDDGKATGLAVYPGARLLKDNDHGGNVVIDTPA